MSANSELSGRKRDSTDLLSTTSVNDNTANPRPSKRQRQSTHKNDLNSSQKLEKNENMLIPQNNINSIPTNPSNLSDEESNEESNEESSEEYNAQNTRYINSKKKKKRKKKTKQNRKAGGEQPNIKKFNNKNNSVSSDFDRYNANKQQQDPHQNYSTIGQIYQQIQPSQIMYEQPPQQQVIYGQPPPQQLQYVQRRAPQQPHVMCGQPPPQQVQYVQQPPLQQVQYEQPPSQQVQYQQFTPLSHQPIQNIVLTIVLIIVFMIIFPVIIYELYHMKGNSKLPLIFCDRADLKCAEQSKKYAKQSIIYIFGYYDDVWSGHLKLWYEQNTQFAAMWIIIAIWMIVSGILSEFSAAVEMKILLMLILLVILDVSSNQSAFFNLISQALEARHKTQCFSMYYNNELTVHILIALRFVQYCDNCFVQIMCHFLVCCYFYLLIVEYLQWTPQSILVNIISAQTVGFDAYLKDYEDNLNIISVTISICVILLFCQFKANRTYKTIFYYVLLILPLAIDCKSRHKYTTGMVESWLGGKVYMFEGLWKQIPWDVMENVN